MSLKIKLFNKKTILSLIIFCIFLPANLHAEPKQRIIIHFKHQLSTENTNNLQRYFKKLGLIDYKLAEHSTNIRWIISFNTHIETPELNRIKTELLKNQHIKYIENDKLLQRKLIM